MFDGRGLSAAAFFFIRLISMKMNPQIGAAVISGASSLFGNLFGGYSQKKQNEFQAAEAAKQRAWQQEMMKVQNQWNSAQWEKEAGYNSAAAQVERFKDAGINPALAMTSGADAGQASSQQSAAPASAPNMPNTAAFTPDMSGFETAAGLIYNMSKQRAEVNLMDKQAENVGLNSKQAQADFDFFMDSYTDRLKGLKLSNKNQRLANENLELGNLFQRRTMEDRIAQESEKRIYMNAQNTMMSLNIKEKEILNKYLDQQQQAELALKIQKHVDMVERLRMDRKLNDAQVKKLLQDVAESEARTSGIKLDNEQKQAIMGHIVQAAYQQTVINDMQIQMGMPDFVRSQTDYDRLSGDGLFNKWYRNFDANLRLITKPFSSIGGLFFK